MKKTLRYDYQVRILSLFNNNFSLKIFRQKKEGIIGLCNAKYHDNFVLGVSWSFVIFRETGH